MRSIDVGDGAQTMVNGSHWRDNRFITISSRKITIASNYPSITKNRSYLDVSFLSWSGFRCSSVHSRDTKIKLYIQVQQLVTLLSFDLLGVFSWERQWTVLKKNGENILEEYMRQPYIWLDICIKEPFYAGCHSVCFSQIAQHSTISNHMTYIFKTHCTQGQPVFLSYRNESDFLSTSYQRWLYPGKSWSRENKFSFLEVTNQIQSLYHMSCGMTLDLIRRVFWLWYPLWFHWVSSAVPLASGLGPSMKPKIS